MKPERPEDFVVTPQEDGTVLITILVNQAVQWVLRGPEELGSALKPFEPPTKKLQFTLCAYDAERIGLDLTRASQDSIELARMGDFNSKAAAAVSTTQKAFL